MNHDKRVVVIIPALDEEASVGKVIEDIPRSLVDEIVVVDNGSTDRTAGVAGLHGAKVISEPRKGYGNACLAGIEYVSGFKDADKMLIVFLDADHSDHPEEMGSLLTPIMRDEQDLVIGSRMLGGMDEDAMHTHAKFANVIICKALSRVLRREVTDMGPFRAIRYKALRDLHMSERTYGWTTEMIVKASRMGLRIKEVPVRYRKRIGTSKISGGLMSSLRAINLIFSCMLKYSL